MNDKFGGASSSLINCSRDFLFETEAESRQLQRVYHLRIGLLTPSSSLSFLEELHLIGKPLHLDWALLEPTLIAIAYVFNQSLGS